MVNPRVPVRSWRSTWYNHLPIALINRNSFPMGKKVTWLQMMKKNVNPNQPFMIYIVSIFVHKQE